ncbi:MAG: type 1 glutamine amidotransferase [Actinomycetales bacterium]|nr:type 1 glutamine amidotransferase [Actinomycetales bacterium]
MRVLFMQHDHLSPPGPVGDAFTDRGYDVVESLVVDEAHYYEPNQPFTFPDPTKFDVLVPMGSPWGAWEDERIGQWLLPELQWLQEADSAGVPVLGLCFGGQILARAHGGSVQRAPDCEIGWTNIWTDDPTLVESGPWFEFHYDRWSLPPGAREVARTTRASQAFVLRRNLALQFHPEVTAEALAGWYVTDGRNLVAKDGQDPDVLLAFTQAEEQSAAQRARRLVNNFLDQVAFA